MRNGVDEVSETRDSSGEAHGGTVESHDEDFGVVEEGTGEVYVVYDEGAEDVSAEVTRGFGGDFALDVGATGRDVSVFFFF